MALINACAKWWIVTLMTVGMTSSASVSGPSSCRCVPDQWQGMLATLEREFDLVGGRTGSAESNVYVSYDYKNGKFAMTDLKTGNRAIADYIKGYKYVIRTDGCRGLQTDEAMRQMCLPDHADFLGEFTLGSDQPVDIWQFTGQQNTSLKTNVIQKNCVPVSEEIYTSNGKYAGLQSSLYLDVTLGIKDRSVFEIPVDCMLDARGRRFAKRTSSDESWSLQDLFKDVDLE